MTVHKLESKAQNFECELINCDFNISGYCVGGVPSIVYKPVPKELDVFNSASLFKNEITCGGFKKARKKK